MITLYYYILCTICYYLIMYQARRRHWDEVCEVWCRVLGRILAGGQWTPDAHYEGTDGLAKVPWTMSLNRLAGSPSFIILL